jgi:ABC-type uncharacterized transport system auxiliary subunit
VSGGRSIVAVVALAVGLAGCLFPDPPAPPRYFAPDTPTARSPVDASPPTGVRIGIVRSPLHLREMMTWRRSDVEYGFYEQRRWTELPSAYVERALERELFGVQRIPPGNGPDAPVVTAELIAFEEVVAPAREARVAIAVTLAGPRCARVRRTFAAARPLEGDDPVAVARGIGEALDEVVAAAGRTVRDALGRGCRGD